ncbi:MAG: hypothetical protein KTR18_09695 [Acidiferrobacterales bacterium]|nr:hypothetical protein [Acidiferrobacterales bacterium]
MITHRLHQRGFTAKLVLTILISFVLTACGGDKSEVTTGGGGSGVVSDGGNPSAQFAGSYVGKITTNLSGDSIDDQSDTEDLIIIVRSNGTASLTIDGETVEGEVNGNQFGFSIRIVEERGLIECAGNAIVSGTISGNTLTGTTDGSGECELVAASTGLRITGSLNATKQ